MKSILSIFLLFISIGVFSQNLDWYETETSSSTLLNGLVAWYEMDGDATDETANALDGSATGVSWVSGLIGQAGDYGGDGDYILVNDDDLLTLSDGFTISMWINPSSLTSWPCYIKKPNEFFLWVYSTGEIRFQVYENGGTTYIGKKGNSAVTTGSYQHLVVTWDGGTTTSSIKVYKNNSDVTGSDNSSIGSLTNGIVNTSSNVYIGKSDTGNNSDGIIDQMIIYNRTMTSAGVDSLYNSGSGVTYSGQL